MKIERILIEDQMAPIGLDEKKPAFSWLLTAEEGEQNLMQSACRIVVRTREDTVWDSGKMETGVSTGIGYEGEALQPCTKYEVKAEVWDNHGGKAEAESSFETGLMDSLYAAWEGAEWIGAPHATVCAENRGVFTIESEFRMEGGKGEAGIVFGANDFRLNDHTKNELGMEGENYIRYAVCLEDGDARLEIYRVGYAPVRIVDRRTAKTRKELFPGVYLYDLEQEMAGVPRITLHEKAGTKIIIRYAEVLYPDLPEYAGKEGTMMLENYRDATSTDVYICRGGEEVFQPKFTFHGYRYIEISGVEHAPELEEVESLQYSSVTEFHGSLTSSHKLLNRFAENVSWSQKCNFINIPTDCPQRNERMGWAGDTHIFCHTALNNSSLKKFYERNLQAMRDLQTPEGQYPEIAPVGGGFGGITYECASIFMAWELYEQYGDIRTLEKFYPGMQKYMDYMKDKGLPGTKVNPAIGPLGDWLAPEETDLLLLWNAFYYKEADLMSRIAGALGRTEEQHQYEALAAKVKKFWNETFVLPDSGKTCNADGTLCDTQCSYAIALSYGVAEDRKRIGEHLIRKTRAIGHTVGTGFFGTGILNQMLTEQGAVEDAWKMMLQTAFPSWLYPVTQGATTIWEHWDSYTKEKGFGGQNAMNSFNHYSLGSVLSWLYHTGLGIQRDETKPGYQHILLKPQPGPLEFMKGSVDSPYGVISAGWERKGDKIEYRVTIPVNTTATLFKNTEDPADTVELGSGTYTFML